MELRIATSRPLPEPDVDEGPLLAALAARGIQARMVAWDDPAEDWAARVPTVVRSTWDYPHRPEAFLAWVERASRAAPLWNPPAVLGWNAHKFYLDELARAGFAVVPTACLERGARRTLDELRAEHGWDDVVIKPAVSAGSFGTLRSGAAEPAEGEAHLKRLLAERDVLVQPYAGAVETSGERALVWIAGELTHAVRKSPRFAGQQESVSAAVPVAADERALAEGLLAWLRTRFSSELLYARIDLVRDEHGEPRLMELELIEPSLFLVQHAPALTRLAEALARQLEEFQGRVPRES